MFKIMFIIGLIGTVITTITTIILFFKCNVVEIFKDLTGIKIIKSKEVVLSGDTESGLSKIITSISRNTNALKTKTNNEAKFKNKDIIKDDHITDLQLNNNLKYIAVDNLKDNETELLAGETEVIEEETNILHEETGLLEEETGLLDEETGLLEDDTDLQEEVLGEGEYVKEIDVVVVNYTSIINI